METFYTLFKKKFPAAAKLAWVCAFVLSLNAPQSWGQTTVSITSVGTAVTQNFNGIGTSATADIATVSSVPTGFRVGTNWSSSLTSTTQAAGTSGTGVLTSSSAGGTYNFANGITASSTDRAVGFLTSSSYSSPRSLVYRFTNNTGRTVTSITLSWNYEKYRSGSRAFAWTFFHGSFDNPSTAAISGDQSYGADAVNTTVYNPPQSVSKSVTITGLNIPNGTQYGFRWTCTGNGGSNNGQALGIDDFSITLNSDFPAFTACNYSQNFNAMGTSGTAPPVGWNVYGNLAGDNDTWASSIPANGTNSVASLGTINNTLLVSTGSGVSSSTQGYNFGASGNSDRALGVSPSTTTGGMLELIVDNNTGASLSSVNLSYDVRRFTAASSINELPGYWVFVSSDNGSNWTEVTALRPTISTVPNTVGVSNFGPTTVTFAAPVSNGSQFRIRWVDDNANETSPDQIIGLDNVVLSSARTVTFDPNGGTGSMTNQSSCGAANLTGNAFTRTGYTFAGWNTAANGSGTAYANGASYPFTASATLYAQWTANTLTVTYNSQGGSAISSGSTTTGGQIAASPGTPTRAGYTFNGWFTASSGGTAISFPYTHNQTANFTLFAQWTANTLTVTFDIRVIQPEPASPSMVGL
jgi:uncharacterized repeat protein (TIGR02543 family)